MLPTITGWIEQWYRPPPEPIAIGWLEAPGARSPVSTDRSSRTTRCVVVSTLCQTIICPAGSVAGFGEKDCAPLMATTLIVTTPSGVEAVGLVGFPPLPLE
jgi:hypothetical protein